MGWGLLSPRRHSGGDSGILQSKIVERILVTDVQSRLTDPGGMEVGVSATQSAL